MKQPDPFIREAPLDGRTLREFAERGFIVVPNVVSADLLDAAMHEIDGIIARQPPPADRCGYHFYWQNDLTALNPLLSLLTDSGAAQLAASLIAPLTLLTALQAQISLNIPPWNHRPVAPISTG